MRGRDEDHDEDGLGEEAYDDGGEGSPIGSSLCVFPAVVLPWTLTLVAVLELVVEDDVLDGTEDLREAEGVAAFRIGRPLWVGLLAFGPPIGVR